ncbi:MAG: hypothetical protein VZR73_14210, partial [Acutalibacteraceae bacterium]|nr:hypothetical protein [Acutalibacteraceae bacterium]
LIFATSPKGEAFETFPASPSGEVPSVSEAEGFLFLCNFQICSFIDYKISSLLRQSADYDFFRKNI